MATSITTRIDPLSATRAVSCKTSAAARIVGCESHYQDDAWKQIKLEGLFLAGLPLIGVLVVAILMLSSFAKHPTAEKILTCGLGGITGSWMYTVRVYVHSVMRGKWRSDCVVERLTTPFTGIFLAISAYTLIETGILGVKFTPNQDTDHASFYTYAVGFFVGLFSEDVMGKLTGVAKSMFGRSSNDRVKKTANRN